MPTGRLFVVATPIGNLGDITLRALDVLRSASVLACEDTRHTQNLLRHHGIVPAQLISVHKFNERKRVEKILGLLQAGRDVALVTDAGTPALCDPGHGLLAAAHAAGFGVIPVPGPSALAAALSVAGMDTDRFVFDGFLPREKGKRRKAIEALRGEARTLVFYEVPHRYRESLRDLHAILGNRPAALLRELTKMHEQVLRSDLAGLLLQAESAETRGEIVLIIAGNAQPPSRNIKAHDLTDLKEEMQSLTKQGISRRDAARRLAQMHGLPPNAVYQKTLNAG